MTRSNATVTASTRLVGSDDRPRFGVVVQLDKRHGGKQAMIIHPVALPVGKSVFVNGDRIVGVEG